MFSCQLANCSIRSAYVYGLRWQQVHIVTGTDDWLSLVGKREGAKVLKKGFGSQAPAIDLC
jgi:hypothetical protein